MDGILLIDKPTGWTSHDVVAKVRSILRQAQSSKFKAQSMKEKPSGFSFQVSASAPKVRVGHTGTLDPMATGLLVLVVGSYTKKAQEFSKLDKTYEAEITLGYTSTTGDSEGEKDKVSDKKPSSEEIEAVLDTFEGKIQQTPPAFSAIKVDGQRAYKLARQGKEVKLESREVTIYKIGDIKYNYPYLKFTAEVSSGTYIRSLAQDIGQMLSTGAYLSTLRRTEVGGFKLDSLAGTINLKDLTKDGVPAIVRALRKDKRLI